MTLEWSGPKTSSKSDGHHINIKMKLEESSWTEINESEFEVALFPVGSTEQHGPHAPLCTDSLIAREIAREASERTDELCLPSLNIGISEEHRQFDGTLHVSPSTFRRFVSETLRSLYEHGIGKTVVVNGHGGNIDALDELCASIYRSEDFFATHWTWWESIDLSELGIEERMGHAGALETSLVMHLRDELVDSERLEMGRDEGSESWGKFVHGSSVGYDSADFSENGVVGDPTNASKEKGEKLFESSADELVSLVEWLRENNPSPKKHR